VIQIRQLEDRSPVSIQQPTADTFGQIATESGIHITILGASTLEPTIWAAIHASAAAIVAEMQLLSFPINPLGFAETKARNNVMVLSPLTGVMKKSIALSLGYVLPRITISSAGQASG
jgi:hypothetical protein